jgi:DNA-binding transcriptional ArsR family regulator
VTNSLAEPDISTVDLATVLAALSDPVRLAYVQALAGMTEQRCGLVLSDTGITISKSTLSHHLTVLRHAGFTHTRLEGVSRYISLRRDDIESRFPGLLDLVTAESGAVAANGQSGA